MALPSNNQLPELRAPIAKVIIGNHTMAQQPQYSRQRVPQNRRADMPDVHRLGHIWRTEIDDDRAGLSCLIKEKVFPTGCARKHFV